MFSVFKQKMCRYRKWKKYETRLCSSSCKSNARADVRNEIFAIVFGTRIIETELKNRNKRFKLEIQNCY